MEKHPEKQAIYYWFWPVFPDIPNGLHHRIRLSLNPPHPPMGDSSVIAYRELLLQYSHVHTRWMATRFLVVALAEAAAGGRGYTENVAPNPPQV